CGKEKRAEPAVRLACGELLRGDGAPVLPCNYSQKYFPVSFLKHLLDRNHFAVHQVGGLEFPLRLVRERNGGSGGPRPLHIVLDDLLLERFAKRRERLHERGAVTRIFLGGWASMSGGVDGSTHRLLLHGISVFT